MVRNWLVWLAAVLATGMAWGCSTNPTTKRSQFILLSRDQEVALGAQSKPQLVQEFGGEVARADLRTYVNEVGMRLVQTTAEDDPSLPGLPWEFTLLDSDVINAFALPGGKVFMSRGLAQLMTNEAQLAGVLGHEIGHVTARHTNERFSKAAAAEAGLGIGGALLGSSISAQVVSRLANKGTELALMSYGRGQESESDTLGVMYMTRCKYDPQGQVQVMEILKQASKGSNPPEILSTHPLPETRIHDLENLLKEKYPNATAANGYQLKEKEFRDRFLSKLKAAYPDAGPSRFARDESERPPAESIGSLAE